MDDRQMIHQIQQGNKEYLNSIAEKYYDDIFRFCCYQTGSREQSYDLAQETFLRFIRYVDHYQYKNLKGYLLTIAMNVCRDYFHWAGKQQKFSDGNTQDLEEICSDGDLTLGKTMEDENARIIREALLFLPPIQREVIILHCYSGLKYREIGKITGAGTSTVKSRMRQGMDKLRKILREEDFYG